MRWVGIGNPDPLCLSINFQIRICIASFCDVSRVATHVSDFVRPRVVRSGNHERVERDVADGPALPPHPAGTQLQAVGLQGPVVPHVADPVDSAMSSHHYDIAQLLAYSLVVYLSLQHSDKIHIRIAT